ncbi:MAG TPA: hypothetical protein PLB79_00495 [Thermotogota bacterium]|jgi:diketogulonate reductase-like aldo/keto reductase|nr:hypothetical protein [Thermotogota bacterium]NLH18757.1 hypothetical protein [Thermotogaceae bacterium]OQC32080.1 MAG: hypothetical protein BWX67_00647 [Thermotogota bacterium ADurb.Bin062]HNW46748.1 hypothetical protein [Thermotogota bacterium]HNY81974.1 hypothetical protein [Thermotogota bacterium]
MLIDEGMFIQVFSIEKDKQEIQKERIINIFSSPYMKEPLVFVAKDNLNKARSADLRNPEVLKDIEAVLSDAGVEYIDLVTRHVIRDTFTKYING